ncbi:L-carnitine dehydratase/bile acid-inducible protein F [Mycolicibacterium canariasense]|uniref:L-carnitine dehydratase/bile acid-inducible protein F n=1 Tax=Mycolicibacterium canariasense TaxID=228230 RepID=A0A100W8J2_MYCCR|nr:CoA transferase [Mycolicibacterium canariasense]MCV7212816.1 CoA transferase [Mycolicibacterium canariasense]ORV12543.1 carnitine dehydratase [Mycolicibacterium canariasense]GAS93787.1 L-carnitine dehydratase/bile acid-inducible protein F [Mycolicibacterium canariasense]
MRPFPHPEDSDPRTRLPLAGINVVDFGQYLAGPAVAMILGDLGAHIVRVEHPDGPMWDSPANAVLNRNKLIVPIDLKTEEGVADAHRLIAASDVVIENFRPGVMARLGIDLAAIREAQPHMITVSLPGFSTDDELRRDWRAFESVIAAASGVFTDMGLNRVLMGVNPSFSPLPLASAYATSMAAASVSIALYARQRTGRGDHIEVPLASAVMEGLSYNTLHVEDYPQRYKTQREQEIDRRRAEATPFDLSYGELQELLDPFYRSYECADGRMFYVVCPSHRYHAKRCLQALGLYQEFVERGLPEEPDVYQPRARWAAGASLGSYPLPKEWADPIAARMKSVFLTKTAAEWDRVFGEGKFPGASQQWLEEWIDDPHVREARLAVEVDDPEYAGMVQPGPVAWLGESATASANPRPRRWGTVAEALDELGRTPRPALSAPLPESNSPWLEGVRVLDLCNVIAGPHSAGFLARFGAEVIKLDPAQPLYDPWNTVVFGMTHMRGKQSTLVDLTSAEGKRVLEKLVASVDVVVWNATDRQVAKLGLDRDGLHRLNPRAIFCQLDCFSGTQPGPRTNYLGYDDLIQAATGIMLRFGGSMASPEEHAHVGTIDVMCGFAASLGIGAALLHREVTGRADRARTSLAALTGLAQIPFFHKYPGRGAFDEPSGPSARGYHALERLYTTRDGETIMLAASDRDVERLSTIDGLGDLPDVSDAGRQAYLEAAFLRADSDWWLNALRGIDVGVARCVDMVTLRNRYTREADGSSGADTGSSYAFSRFTAHPSGHTVTQLDPIGVRLSQARVVAPEPAEKYGASTAAVLRSVGFSDDDVDTMLTTGAISTSWSDEYLPS